MQPFDGANIWVTNLLSNTVSKLRASDGHTLGTYATGKEPWGIPTREEDCAKRQKRSTLRAFPNSAPARSRSFTAAILRGD
jgi:hypothetical protein